MRILRLEPDDVIIAPFAVIAVAVAFQGETLLSLFVFVLWRTFPDWTHLPRRFRDWEFSLSNFLLNSQLQRVDLGPLLTTERLASPVSFGQPPPWIAPPVKKTWLRAWGPFLESPGN